VSVALCRPTKPPLPLSIHFWIAAQVSAGIGSSPVV
jgi:hypothetical protein